MSTASAVLSITSKLFLLKLDSNSSLGVKTSSSNSIISYNKSKFKIHGINSLKDWAAKYHNGSLPLLETFINKYVCSSYLASIRLE